MSDNELMIVDEAALAVLADELGVNAEDLQGGGKYLPSLRVWGKDDAEEEDAPRLKGKMYVTGIEGYDEPIFVVPNTITFRPLTQTFQWTQYDKEQKKTVNRTRLIPNFNEEARDEKGTIRCGKPPSKDLKDNKALQKLYEDITLYRRLQGILNFTGKTAAGKEVKVENLLSSINLKGANFLPFDEEFAKKLPAKSRLWDWVTSISTTRHVNGQVTYWVFHFDCDFKEKEKVTPELFQSLIYLQGQINDMNKAIDKSYYDAINNKQSSEDAISALKTVNSSLQSDMDDDIPFN